MSKANIRRHDLERNKLLKEKEKPSQNILSKHLKRVYPIGLQRTSSSFSLSSLSLSLSQNSNDSSLTDSTTPLHQKISLALRLIAPSERRDAPVAKTVQQQSQDTSTGELKRCNWITNNSGKLYNTNLSIFKTDMALLACKKLYILH